MKTRKLFAIVCLLTAAVLYAGTEDQQERTKTFSVQKGGKLEVSVNPGDITITTWNKNEVVVKIKGLDDDEIEDVELKQFGNTVSVKTGKKWGWTSNADYMISIPDNFNVEVRTTAGDIEFKGNLKGEINANSAGGDISMNNVDGNIKVYSSGGDIKTGNVTGDLKINTQGGDVKIGVISGKLSEVVTMGGDIQIENTTSDVEATTYGGEILIGDIGGNAKAVTYGGDIKFGKVSGSVKSVTYGGNIELKSASGKVSAETYGGNLLLKNVTGSVNAKTQAGNIYVELNPSGTDESNIQTNAGEVQLALPSTAKATINAEIRVRGWWDESDDVDILSEYPAVKVQKDEDQKEIRGEYKLNGGGAEITVKTINSNIKITKLK